MPCAGLRMAVCLKTTKPHSLGFGGLGPCFQTALRPEPADIWQHFPRLSSADAQREIGVWQRYPTQFDAADDSAHSFIARALPSLRASEELPDIGGWRRGRRGKRSWHTCNYWNRRRVAAFCNPGSGPIQGDECHFPPPTNRIPREIVNSDSGWICVLVRCTRRL
jgi:hypothetical protein